MNWYKYCQKQEEEWRWDRLRSWVGTGAILGFAALLAISVTTLREEYARNPQVIERKLIEYKNTVTEPNVVELVDEPNDIEPVAEPNFIEPIVEPIAEPNVIEPKQQAPKVESANINIDKIWDMESSKGTSPSMGKSKAGARGHFQFMKGTWDGIVSKMGKNWDWKNGSMDYGKSKQVAEYYFNKEIPNMIDHYKIPDTVETRLAAYNWGIGGLRQAWKDHKEKWKDVAPKETTDYILKYYGKK